MKTPAQTMSTASAQGLRAGGGKLSRASGESKNQDSLQAKLAKLATIVQGVNPMQRNRALLAFLGQLSPADFGAAVAHFKSLGMRDNRTADYGMLLSAWTQADPLAAVAYMEAYAKNDVYYDFVKDSILTTWATDDPEAAIRWAKSEAKGEGPNPYLAGIIRGIAQNDLTRAVVLLTDMPPSAERGKAMDSVIPYYLTQGPTATRNWIASLADESLKNDAMERAAESLEKTYTAETVAWLIAHPGNTAQHLLRNAIHHLAKKDTQAALTSFEGLPAGRPRELALQGLMQYMGSKNPAAGISLMDRYPGDVTGNVVESFMCYAEGIDTEAAANQMERFVDEKVRDYWYGGLLERWLKKDSTAAKTWMAKNEMPDAVRERLESLK